MSLEKLNAYCALKLDELEAKGAQKGKEKVIADITTPDWVKHGRLPTRTSLQTVRRFYSLDDLCNG